MKTPHVHAELIKAWVDDPSIEIECRNLSNTSETWYPIIVPTWLITCEYRIKPRVFPVSSLTFEQIYDLMWPQSCTVKYANRSYYEPLFKTVVDAAIKQHILDTEAAK